MPRELDLDIRVNLRALIDLAGDLVSEDGETPEYDRALAELCTEAAGLGQDDKDMVMGYIREASHRLRQRTGPHEPRRWSASSLLIRDPQGGPPTVLDWKPNHNDLEDHS